MQLPTGSPFDADPGGSGFMAQPLAKAPTGIRGFDGISAGGLPRGRPTLVAGASGTGKTMFALEFLLRGARDFGEPGVMFTFEESRQDLIENMATLGFNLEKLLAEEKLIIDDFHIEPAEIVATGNFDLEGLFLRLEKAIDAIGAKRIVLDTIEVLLASFGNDTIVRGELSRLFRWFKERNLTAVVTEERGRDSRLTRYGFEEVISDCAILLDHRVHEEISTRRLRILKYRGSEHGTNEYPFLITNQGFVVLPDLGAGYISAAPIERLSTGMEQLDQMLSGGIFRGATMLISGRAGTGKTTIAAQLVEAACTRGERCLFISFEESQARLIRNMRSVGIDLQQGLDTGLLKIWAERSAAYRLEEHLGRLDQILDAFKPQVVVLDAMRILSAEGPERSIRATVAMEIDMLKSREITAVITSLIHGDEEETNMLGVSSLTDSWLMLRNIETNGERSRLLCVIKSRGMSHSNQVREFKLTPNGAQLVDVMIDSRGAILTGSARKLQLDQLKRRANNRLANSKRNQIALQRRKAVLQAQIADLENELDAASTDLKDATQEQLRRQAANAEDQMAAEKIREVEM